MQYMPINYGLATTPLSIANYIFKMFAYHSAMWQLLSGYIAEGSLSIHSSY